MRLKNFAQQARAFRRAQELTQVDVAERVGVHHSVIAKIEAGQHRPTRKLQSKLAQTLNLPDDPEDQ